MAVLLVDLEDMEVHVLRLFSPVHDHPHTTWWQSSGGGDHSRNSITRQVPHHYPASCHNVVLMGDRNIVSSMLGDRDPGHTILSSAGETSVGNIIKMRNKDIGIGNGVISDSITDSDSDTVDGVPPNDRWRQIFQVGTDQRLVNMRCASSREMVQLDKAKVSIIHCETASKPVPTLLIGSFIIHGNSLSSLTIGDGECGARSNKIASLSGKVIHIEHVTGPILAAVGDGLRAKPASLLVVPVEGDTLAGILAITVVGQTSVAGLGIE